MKGFLQWILFLPPAATGNAEAIDRLHAFVISLAMLGGFGVLSCAVWFVWRGTKPGAVPLKKARNKRFEILSIGGTLTLFVGLWIVGFRQYVALREGPAEAMIVYVTAKEWMWKFSYEDGQESIDELTVPVNVPVRLVMTSRDVIHSFYVPAFRLKQDVVPGRFVSMWFSASQTGTFPLLCAEYCGLSHSGMLGTVRVLSPSDYARWSASPTPGHNGVALVEEGMRVAAQKSCLACHSLDGRNHVGPTWRGLFGSNVKLDDGRFVHADVAYLTESMTDPNDAVVAGYKPVMPSYLGQLTPNETAALVELIRSLREPVPPEVESENVVDGGVGTVATDAGTQPDATRRIGSDASALPGDTIP